VEDAAVTPLRPRRVLLAREELSDSDDSEGPSEGSSDLLLPSAEHGEEDQVPWVETEYPPEGRRRLGRDRSGDLPHSVARPVEEAAAAPLTLMQEEVASREVRVQWAMEAELADWASEASSSASSAGLSLSSVEDEAVDAASPTRRSMQQASSLRHQAPAEAAEAAETTKQTDDSDSSPSPPPLRATQRTAHRSQLAHRMKARLGSVTQQQQPHDK